LIDSLRNPGGKLHKLAIINHQRPENNLSKIEDITDKIEK